MKRSTDRILTTHVGSLPRPPDLLELNTARATGKPVDEKAWATRVKQAVAETVRKQRDAGIDIVDDGELSKPNWSGYVTERLGGFEQKPSAVRYSGGADRRNFAGFYEEYERIQPFRQPLYGASAACTGPISYRGEALVRMDIENLKAALAGRDAVEAFIPSVAPGSFLTRANEYYKSEAEFLEAIAEAMHVEYKAIVDAGFLLQLDDPGIVVFYDRGEQTPSPAGHRKRMEPAIEALNHALRGIPEEKVRYHICWGGWHGPHSTDLPLEEIMPLVLKAKVGAYVVEAANARHEHEWRYWQQHGLPAGKLLIPGAVSHATNVIEHPQLVCDRIVRLANIVGRENIVASTDCGVGGRVHEEIAWAKLATLAEGAKRASGELWKKS
jgi:5-methyltetrahydropteroyltriglutamate--homocysteine methyltransferase